jgi:hypothetical protein
VATTRHPQRGLAAERDSIDARTVNCRIWIALLLGSTISGRAHAAEPTKAEIAVARQYFDAATAAENQGRWRDAIDQLTKAIAIKETAGLRYHLGFAKENLGMLVDAMLEYQRASGLVHSGMTSEEVERFIVPKLEEMRKRVPTLTVTLPPDVKSAQLQIDGTTVKPELLGTPIPLNPGAHAVVVFAQGRRPFHVQITVSEGSAVTQAAELVPEVGGAVAPTEAGTPPHDGRNLSAEGSREGAPGETSDAARTWVLVGEGTILAAGVAVALGYFAAAESAQTRYDDARSSLDAHNNSLAMPLNYPCLSTDPVIQADCARITAAFSDHDRDRKIMLGGFIASGVGATALVATLLLWKPASKGQSVFIGPQLGSSVRGAMLGWTF